MSECQQCFNLFSQYTGTGRMEKDLSDISDQYKQITSFYHHMCAIRLVRTLLCVLFVLCIVTLWGQEWGGVGKQFTYHKMHQNIGTEVKQ